MDTAIETTTSVVSTKPVDVFLTIKGIAEKKETETRDEEIHFYKAYKDDLLIHDADMIKYDSQSLDIYIWILKSNGCGTAMIFCGEKAISSVEYYGEDSLYYRISFTEIGKGYVEEVSMQEAMKIQSTVKTSPSRKPRRVGHSQQIERILPDINIRDSLFYSELRNNSNEITLVKVTLCNAFYSQLTVVRTLINPREYEDESSMFKIKTYAISTPLSALGACAKELLFVIKNTQEFYCEIDALTNRKFTNAIEKHQ